MDIQRGLPLSWTYFYQEKVTEDLRQSQMLDMELEDTRLKAQEELRIRDEQIVQLQVMLSRAIQERDGAQEKCQNVYFEKLMLQQQLQQQSRHSAPNSGVSSTEDDPARGADCNNGFSASDSDESTVSSPPNMPLPPEQELPAVFDVPLPEKGRLLQAVMKAGPLLNTLLLAGPLPQWRHPPPPLDSYQIPPPPVVVPSSPPLPALVLPVSSHPIHQQPLPSNITNYGRIKRKRAASESSDDSIDIKFPVGDFFELPRKCHHLLQSLPAFSVNSNEKDIKAYLSAN